jgi:hypothetical protein
MQRVRNRAASTADGIAAGEYLLPCALDAPPQRTPASRQEV